MSFIIHYLQVDSFLIEEGGSLASSEPEPEFLLSRAPPHSPEPEYQQQGAGVDQETQARLEALLEAAGISRLSGESKQLADPDILRRLTSSVRSASLVIFPPGTPAGAVYSISISLSRECTALSFSWFTLDEILIVSVEILSFSVANLRKNLIEIS